jgi:hypothetical protein
MEDKVAYLLSTLLFLIIIGFMMFYHSGWWFLTLFFWHWRWVKEWDDQHPN